MLSINIFFVLSASITISISNGELSEKIKKNMKFVCGEAVLIGGHSGHINGPGNLLSGALYRKDKFPRNFTLQKPIIKEDNLTIEYGVQCGAKTTYTPVPINICDILDSQSNDEKTNLYKAFLDFLGFSMSSSCPIPEGNYSLKQENVIVSWFSDFFGSKCSVTNDGALVLKVMDEGDQR